ncbi:hypothetical protein MSG28_012733 [Choristoneura fumiferana]|uniref:Uncharacterized protein n=1 Tax=Choristoneura fumiferana TaxID=7141 RepID=A0ACC0JHR8_CHOFU|nr:hypothetical protein MSG28_012733 [Choristoneura fumiferana]
MVQIILVESEWKGDKLEPLERIRGVAKSRKGVGEMFPEENESQPVVSAPESAPKLVPLIPQSRKIFGSISHSVINNSNGKVSSEQGALSSVIPPPSPPYRMIQQDAKQTNCAASCGTVNTLKSLHIHAPKAVLSGRNAELMCSYELEGAQLYSIRWYRNMIEFYRYVPKESPATKVFPVAEIKVDVAGSDQNRVVLTEVDRTLTGEYQCEVSADAPLFHTDIKAAEMIVVGRLYAVPQILHSPAPFKPLCCQIFPSRGFDATPFHMSHQHIFEPNELSAVFSFTLLHHSFLRHKKYVTAPPKLTTHTGFNATNIGSPQNIGITHSHLVFFRDVVCISASHVFWIDSTLSASEPL